MKNKKQNLVKYKREKNKVEIIGDAKDTRGFIWLDMITSKFWIILVIVLLFIVPKASFLPLLWIWIKRQGLFLTLLLTLDHCWSLLLLSG